MAKTLLSKKAQDLLAKQKKERQALFRKEAKAQEKFKIKAIDDLATILKNTNFKNAFIKLLAEYDKTSKQTKNLQKYLLDFYEINLNNDNK